MKLLKVLIPIFIYFIGLGISYSKPLPPGTGNTVPANILFLVDGSQSMWDPSSGETKNKYFRPPNDVAPKGDGKYFTISVDNSGLGHWDPYNDKIYRYKTRNPKEYESFLANPSQKLRVFQNHKNSRAMEDGSKRFQNTLHMEFGGKNFLYTLQDRTMKDAGGYTLLALNVFFNKNGGQKYFRKSHATTLTGLYEHNKAPNDTDRNQAIMIKNKPAIAHFASNNVGGKLLLISRDAWRVISLNNTGYFTSSIVCPDSANSRQHFDDAIDVVKEGSDYYAYGKDGDKIFKSQINNDTGCPTGTTYTNWKNNNNVDQCGNGKGDSIAVHNKKIFTTGHLSAKVCKYSQSGSSITLESSVGVKDAFAQNSTSAPNVYFDRPMGITIGAGNATEQSRIYVASFGRSEITILEQSDLSYVDHFGDSGVSLWKGAEEAISYVLRDSSINQQANFGFGVWTGAKGTGDLFQYFKPNNTNPKYNEPYPCKKLGCLYVGINPEGGSQILELFQQNRIELNYATNGQSLSNLMNTYWKWADVNEKPYDADIDCQVNAIIVIGDGEIKNRPNDPITAARMQLSQRKILTFAIGYGQGLSARGVTNLKNIAIAGGTHDPAKGKIGYFDAKTPADLKNVTDQIVQTIISSLYSFSSPSVSSEINETGVIYQSKFQNRKNKEWWGTVRKTNLTATGDVNVISSNTGVANTPQAPCQGGDNWDASECMPTPVNRNVWTAAQNLPAGKNNFTDANITFIKPLMNLSGTPLKEFHKATIGSDGVDLTYCTGLDGTNGDEDIGLIRFVRGEDYFDYDNDCNLREERTREEEIKTVTTNSNGTQTVTTSKRTVKSTIADIYNGELVFVGPPRAETELTDSNTESNFRRNRAYQSFANLWSSREELIYATANNGVLHAFNAKTGIEKWGFVPPLIIPKLPRIINPSLNTKAGGGSVPIFLLDGSPTVHDTYFSHPSKGLNWYTLMMVPYGRGGAGFSVIDITDPDNPNHLYSILNDYISEQVIHMSHDGTLSQYSYKTTRVNIKDFDESIDAINNAGNGNTTCDATGTSSCYLGKTWTISGTDIDSSLPITVTVNGSIKTPTIRQVTATQIELKFTNNYKFNHSGSDSDNINVSQIGGFTGLAELDYRYLGETWASPRVIRMPSNSGDTNIFDDKYVAVLPGGFGNFVPKIGSNVFVIDFTNGKIIKEIKINDSTDTFNDVINSVPNTPVVVTPDTTRTQYTGALVYVNDLEGKITKINLSNVSEPQVSLYDSQVIFDVQASRQLNNRMMYHSLDAGKSPGSERLWLFGGTGDLYNLTDVQVDLNKVNNIYFGIKDIDFPTFKSKTNTTTPTPLLNCTDTDGQRCYADGKMGWYIDLSDQKKVVNEPTFTGNYTYYPIFKPNRNSSDCGTGKAYVCAVDSDCGKSAGSDLKAANTSIASNDQDDCLLVGDGVLSKLVSFGTNLYANISDKSTNSKKDDLVLINSIAEDIQTFRSSWRYNF